MATSKEIKEEYTSSLADLTFNSRPLITVLTMLAEENAQHARDIVEAIETHLSKVRTDVKLPVLYLIDCIIKNVGGPYLELFCQNIVPTFCSVFQSVDERTRAEMFKLRQTWNEYLPPQKLYALDVQIKMLDPAWPVSAKPPSSLIHVNPKFLNSTNNTNSSTAKKGAGNAKQSNKVLSSSTTAALDPQTLDMQQKLINKQKQLIELQQKKIELELLQAQVKLQEQIKNSGSVGKTKTTPASSANPLLKPEVAKQLVNTTAANKPAAVTSVTSTSVRPRAAATQSSSVVMNQRLQNSGVAGSAGPKIVAPSSALIAASRLIRDPRLRRQQQNQNSVVNSNVQLESKPQVDSPNKIVVSSKMNVRDNRTDPRSVTNKDSASAPPEKAKSVVRPFPKSRSKLHDGSARKPVRPAKTLDTESKGDSSSKSSSASSLDSPTKVRRDKKFLSPTKSPSKIKKKDADRKVSPKQSPGKGESHKPQKTDAASPPTFKDIKLSMKNRNYIRRNRKTSESPDAARDVDLRLGGPPEKQGEAAEDKSASNCNQGMDVDLRQLPAVISKKRPSTETMDANNPKKSKTEMFDVLFGNEDTDLRQLPAPVASPPCDKPPTPPPPPIISSKPTYKENRPFDPKTSPKRSNLDALRAKLNSATLKDKLLSERADMDLRSFMSPPQASPEKPCKIVITPDDEQSIKSRNLSPDRQTALWNKIVSQINPRDGETLGNISLQPISDEEMEGDFSEEEDARRGAHGDRDERVPPLHQKPYYGRNRPGWRGRRPKYYEARPGMRPGVRPEGPWARNLNGGPWRPMGPAQAFGRANDGYGPAQMVGEFGQDAGADGAAGRTGGWMRPGGPWRSFNRGGDGFVPAHRMGDQGDYAQENVPSPDRNSNSPHIFQSITQPPINNMDLLSNVVSSVNEGPDRVENATAPVAPPPPPLNINELLQKLVESGIVTTTASEQPLMQVPSPKAPVTKKTLTNIKPITFAKPETLKVLQPTVYQLLYSGMQCSSCGMRFPPEQSMLYSQHLDWHFRQNRKGKKNIRKAASRRWYYTLADWKNYEEIEDLEEREKSYFDQQQAQTEGANEEAEEEIDIPTVPADPNVQDAHCEICQDRFEQFYNEEKEEWHLRMAIRVNDRTYHPLCYEDYQASMNIPIDISAGEDAPPPTKEEDKRIPGLEIVLDDDEEEEEEEESVPKTEGSEEAVREENGEEDKADVGGEEEEEDDDVILNEVAPERIVLDDDDDNEEMVSYAPPVQVKIEPVDDGFMDVDGVVKVKKDGEIKIKAEPKDLDESLELEESPKAEAPHSDMVFSIDGNVEFDAATAATPGTTFGGRIKINISKPLPAVAAREAKEAPVESELSKDTFIDPSQPLPPGEEPVQLNVKPALQGVELRRLPPVEKGRELTGLCSIM